jgi:hypothetical protein
MKQEMNLKKLLFLLLLICIQSAVPALVHAQAKEEKPKYAPGKEKHRNRTDEIGRKQGKWMFYNTFGEKISEIDFVNDQKEGVERKFYAYDRVKEETEYLAGVKEGSYTKYYFSSQVQLEGSYKDGKKDGKWTRYFEDGSIRQEGSYVDGKRDGVWKTYNRKGAVVSQAAFKGGINVEEIEAKKKKDEDAKKAAEKKNTDKKGPTIVKPGTPGTPPSTPQTGPGATKEEQKKK